MRVLLVCTWKTPYLVQIWQYVKKYFPNVKYSVLTLEENRCFFEERLNLEEGEGIYSYDNIHDPLFLKMRKIINDLPQFDVIHFMWIDWYYGLWVQNLSRKANYIFASVGGSDLYRDSRRWFVRFFQKRIIRRSDWLSSENIGTKDYFYKVYGDSISNAPHSIIRYGVDILDGIIEIDKRRNVSPEYVVSLKEKWGIPHDKIIVTCGYNGRVEHQHLKMIESFEKCSKEVLDKYFFVIPMTYAVASEEYVNEVSDRLSQVVGTDGFIIMREFMNVDEMAENVVISDVMIHVQTTDQMSSTMLAHMYNGNIVIAGDWLPYEFLREEGVNFYDVKDCGGLNWYLDDICGKIDEYKSASVGNADIIYRLSSWESMSGEWYKVYDELMKRRK